MNEIAKPAGGMPAAASVTPPTSLNINQADLRLGANLPVYKIQQREKNGLEPGKITTPDGQAEQVEFTLLAMSFSRVLMPSFKDPETRPLCKSSTGERPDGGIQPRRGPCNSCPESRWQNHTPPSCDEVFALWCWDHGAEEPFVFFIKKTAITALRKFRSRLMRTKRYLVPGVEPQCSLRCEMTVALADDGNYYLPQFSILGGCEPKLAHALQETAHCCVAMLAAQQQQQTFSPTPPAPTPTQSPPPAPAPAQAPAKTMPPVKTTPPPAPPDLPDISQPGWEETEVPFRRCAGLLWEDLIYDAPLPAGDKTGREYLRNLAHWKDRPEVAEVARAALALARAKDATSGPQESPEKQDEKLGADDNPPF
jgi:hypothetical protein